MHVEAKKISLRNNFWSSADLPDPNFLYIRDKSADSRFCFRGSVDGLLGLCVLRCVGTWAYGTRARRRGSAAQKQEVYSSHVALYTLYDQSTLQ